MYEWCPTRANDIWSTWMILWVPQLEQILFVVHGWMQMILQYAFFQFLIVGTGNDWEWMGDIIQDC